MPTYTHRLPWQPVGILLGESPLPHKDLGAQLDHIQVVVDVLPVGLGGDIQDGVYRRVAGHEVQFSNGRNKRALAATQEEDGDLRPAIVGENVAHAPAGILSTAYSESLRTRRH